MTRPIQVKPWNYGPRSGTKTYKEMMKAAGIPVSVISISNRIQKKVGKAFWLQGQRTFQGRCQRLLAREFEREQFRDAEDKIYGGT